MLTSSVGNHACKPPAFSRWTVTTWLKRARKDILEPFLRPVRNRALAEESPNPSKGRQVLPDAWPWLNPLLLQRHIGGNWVDREVKTSSPNLSKRHVSQKGVGGKQEDLGRRLGFFPSP